MANKTPAQERAEIEHARFCRDLVAAMSEFVEEDTTGGRGVAQDLLDEHFGLSDITGSE
jgi:hypothetical protein